VYPSASPLTRRQEQTATAMVLFNTLPLEKHVTLTSVKHGDYVIEVNCDFYHFDPKGNHLFGASY